MEQEWRPPAAGGHAGPRAQGESRPGASTRALGGAPWPGRGQFLVPHADEVGSPSEMRPGRPQCTGPSRTPTWGNYFLPAL